MNYYRRNQRWLNPLIAVVILAAWRPLLSSLDEAVVNQALKAEPAWVTSLTWPSAFLGVVAVGFGAALTETLSAEILKLAVPGVFLALLLVVLDVSVGTVALCTVVAWVAMGTLRIRSR
jgi:hypothetical protein